MKTKEYEVETEDLLYVCVLFSSSSLLLLYASKSPAVELINDCQLLAIKIGSRGIKIFVTLDISFMVLAFHSHSLTLSLFIFISLVYGHCMKR
jgi:hypothetical protein